MSPILDGPGEAICTGKEQRRSKVWLAAGIHARAVDTKTIRNALGVLRGLKELSWTTEKLSELLLCKREPKTAEVVALPLLCVRKHRWEGRTPEWRWSQMDSCWNHTLISLKGHPLIPKQTQLYGARKSSAQSLQQSCGPSSQHLHRQLLSGCPSSSTTMPHRACRSYTSLSPVGSCKIIAEHFSLPLLTSNLSQKGSKKGKMGTNH